jgi:hypothetical protein
VLIDYLEILWELPKACPDNRKGASESANAAYQSEAYAKVGHPTITARGIVGKVVAIKAGFAPGIKGAGV